MHRLHKDVGMAVGLLLFVCLLAQSFFVLSVRLRNQYYAQFYDGIYQMSAANVSGFHVVSVGNRLEKAHYLVDSAKQWSLPLTVLGVGSQWQGLLDKPLHLQAYLQHLPDHDIVMFVDAYDVFIHASSSDLIQTFKSFNKPLVFSTDNWLFPDIDVGSKYPSMPSSIVFRYLNSGASIGYVWAYKEMLKSFFATQCADALGRIHSTKRTLNLHQENDQRCATTYYLSHPDRVVLDHEMKLFAGLNELHNQKYFSVLAGGAILNHITHQRSKVFHGNGFTGKMFLDVLYKRLH
ncbi:MAG: hypothetical protein VYC40_00085 [Pseudomonadota bacterium]|nr:hypothetical protein [Pseudomonadota bacterium]